MYVCKSGNSYRTISTLQNTSSWKGSIRIIKSKRLLLEGPYKTEPHSEESSRTPRTLAVLVPCSVPDHGLSEESFISIPSELPLTQFHSFALCLVAGPYREKTSAYLLPALKGHGWGHPSAPFSKGNKASDISYSSCVWPSKPFTVSVTLVWTHSRSLMSF